MRKHISIIILLLVVIAVLSACGIIRQDMYKPVDDTNKGSATKITIDIGDGLVTSESGASDSFQVVLNEAPASGVTFPISSMNLAEVTVLVSSITFTTTNWNITQTVNVSGVDDVMPDGHQPVIVAIGTAVSADPNWNGFNPPDVTVYNIDNDLAQVPGVTVSSSGPLLLSETGASGSFAVVLNTQPLNNVTIPVSVSDSTETTITSPFSGASGNLVFTSANWSTPQVILVRGVDDSEVDGNYAGSITIGVTSSGDLVYNGTFNPPDVPFTNVDNDMAGITVNAGASMVVSESGTSASFMVVLNSRPSSDVIIPVTVSDPTEGTVTSPLSGSLTFTFADWDAPQNVTLAGVNDWEADGNMIFTVTLGAASSTDPNYNGINPPDVTFTNVDDDAAGVTVNAGSSMLVSESGTNSSFTIVLNSQPIGNVTIPVSVSDTTEGTITAPFFGATGSLVFTGTDWNAPKAVSVAGVRDALADGNQPFNIVLGATSSPDSKYNGTFDPPDVTFTCIDDYRPGVTVIAGSPMIVSESGTSASFQVVLNSKPTNDVTIPVSVTDSTEGIITAPFAGPSGTILFTDTDWNVPRTITVSGVGDSLTDGDQGFNVVLGATSSTDPIYNGTFGPTNVHYICIDENGPAAVIVIAGSPMMVSESGTSSSFQVVLVSPPSSNVDITLSISDTTEGIFTAPLAGTSATITFTPGTWNILQAISVTGVKDALADGNQSFLADFGLTSSLDPNYNGLTVSDVTYVCIDDYSAGVTVNAGDPATPMMVSEIGTTSSFTVVLNSKPSNTVSIDISVSDAGEGKVTVPFSATFGTITFDPGNWNIPQTVTVMGMNDAIADGSQPFTLQLSNTSSADPLYNGLATLDVSFINIDNDTVGITVNAGSSMLVSESGTSSTFTVVLNSQPTADVTIQVQVMDGSEGKVIAPFNGTSGVLTFTSVNWNTAQTVKVEGVDDYVADSNQPFTVELIPAVSADPAYDTFNPNDVSFVNVDNDSAGITVNIGDGLITKEHPTAPLSDTFKVMLNSAPTDNVTIGSIASSNVSEVTVSPSGLTFTPGNWNNAQTVTVTGVDDPWGDGVQIVTIDLGLSNSTDPSYNGRDPGDVIVYNIDNEAPPKILVLQPSGGYHTSEDGAMADITVLLSAMPANTVTLPSIVSSDPTEGSVVTTSLTFNPADWDSPKTVWVAGVTDGGRGDGDVSYTVNLGTVSSSDLDWNGFLAGSVSVVNMDHITIPDYGWSPPSAGSFAPISGTGNVVNFKDNDYFDARLDPKDEGYEFVPMGLTFYYLGHPYTQITVYTNGFCSFSPYINTANVYDNKNLFDNSAQANLFINILAPWWDDLTLNNIGADVYYTTTGSAPNRVFTVEWTNALQIGSSKSYTFQLRLFESSSVVEFVYGPKNDPGGSDATASVGMKDDVGGNNHFRDGFNGVFDGSSGGPKDNRKFTEFPAFGNIIRFTP